MRWTLHAENNALHTVASGSTSIWSGNFSASSFPQHPKRSNIQAWLDSIYSSYRFKLPVKFCVCGLILSKVGRSMINCEINCKMSTINISMNKHMQIKRFKHITNFFQIFLLARTPTGQSHHCWSKSLPIVFPYLLP